MKLSDIYMRDPFMYVEDDVCYLIGTTDESCWGGKAFGFLGYKSKDLVNFEGPFTLFKNDGNFWADENYWAPEMYKINGKYYIFASFYKKGLNRCSQALVCDTPLGKYIPTKKPFTPKDWGCLDATYWSENGKHYTVFSREWSMVHDGEIYVGELDNEICNLSNITLLFKASEAKWSVPFFCGDSKEKNYVTDGPFIYKTKKGSLLMLWSSNSFDGYALGIAKSENGILGPWIQSDKPLFSKDGGHGMIFEYKGKKYLILHTSNAKHLLERPYIREIFEEDDYLKIRGE